MKQLEKQEKDNKGKAKLQEKDKNKMIDEAFFSFSSACVECPGKFLLQQKGSPTEPTFFVMVTDLCIFVC